MHSLCKHEIYNFADEMDSVHYNYGGTRNNSYRLENIEMPRDIFKRILITGIIKFITFFLLENINFVAKTLYVCVFCIKNVYRRQKNILLSISNFIISGTISVCSIDILDVPFDDETFIFRFNEPVDVSCGRSLI